jgi:hypothetical protein
MRDETRVLPEAEVLPVFREGNTPAPRISWAGQVRSLDRVRLTPLRESDDSGEQPDGWTPAPRLHLPFERYGTPATAMEIRLHRAGPGQVLSLRALQDRASERQVQTP